jgi:hypothetical protein
MTEEKPPPAIMTHSSPLPEPIINPNLTSTSNISEKFTNDDVIKMKVVELKDCLKKRGLSTNGRKSELQLRMKEALEKDVQLLTTTHHQENAQGGIQQNNTGAVTATIPARAGGTFDVGAYWEVLEQDGEVMQDQLNIDGT